MANEGNVGVPSVEQGNVEYGKGPHEASRGGQELVKIVIKQYKIGEGRKQEEFTIVWLVSIYMLIVRVLIVGGSRELDLENADLTGRWRGEPQWKKGGEQYNNANCPERWRCEIGGRVCGGGRKQVVESGAACSEHEFPRADVPAYEELWRCDEPERNVDKCICVVQSGGKWQCVTNFRHVWSTVCVLHLWIRRLNCGGTALLGSLVIKGCGFVSHNDRRS